MTTIYLKTSLLALATFVLSIGGAWAQTSTSGPMNIVVGFASGGPTDIVSRLVAKALGDELGRNVIVENKPGAGSTIAAAQVARGAADGNTMLLVVGGLTGAESLFPNRGYSLKKDFAPISLIGTSINWLLTPVNGEFKTAQDMVRLVTVNPGKYSYGQGGTGGVSHLSAEWMKISKGMNILQVPYRGNGPALIDLAAGRIDLIFDQPISSESFVTSGKLRPLAVTAPQRLPAYPNIPTMQEAGFPGFVVEVWYGLVFPVRTPKPLIQAVNAALARALAKNEVKASLERAGVVPQSSTPEQLQKRIETEIDRWQEVIVKANIKAE